MDPRPAPGLAFLGPPAVVDEDGELHEIRGERPSSVLAVLACHHGHRVPSEVVREEVWGPREGSDGLLRVTVKRLRTQLEMVGLERVVVTDRLGLRLDVSPEALDTWVLEQTVRRATELRSKGRPDAILDLVQVVDGMWRGRPYEGADDAPSVVVDATRLERLRDELKRSHATARVHLGDYRDAVHLLRAVLDLDPYDEEAVALLAAAEYSLGHQREALRVASDLHRRLAEEAGLVAGPCPRRVEQLILDGAAAGAVLAAALGVETPALVVGRRHHQPAWSLVGRRDTVEQAVADLGVGPATLLLGGPAGSGKTRVGSEVAERLAAACRPVIWCTCDRWGEALSPIPDLFTSASSLVPGGIGRDRVPALDSIFAHPPGEASGPPLDAELVRVRLRDAVEQLLQGAPAGTVVVVDDLQWIADDAAALLARLVTGSAPVGWLLLCRSADQTRACRDLLAELGRHGHHLADLGPLGDRHLERLCNAVDPSVPVRVVAELVRRAEGNPFVAIELTRHVGRGGEPEAIPESIQSVLGAALSSLSDPARHLVALLALEQGLSFDAMAELVHPADPVDLVDELVTHGVGRLTADRTPRLAHDLWADVALGAFDKDRLRGLHHAIAGAVKRSAAAPEVVLRHLLDADDLATDLELDATASDGISSLMSRGALADAAQLARRYIDRRGIGHGRRERLAAQVQSATALLTVGELDAGVALLDATGPQLDRSLDAELSADLILARGAVDVGGVPDPSHVEEILDLANRLDGDIRRVIQLRAWAAHLLLNQADRIAAKQQLDQAEAVLASAAGPDPFLRGLVLGIRYQSCLLADRDPADATEAHRRLRGYAALTGEVSTEAMAAMFEIDQALRHRDRVACDDAVAGIATVSERLTRPDVRWWAPAARATVALAAGDLQEAEVAIDAAGELGRRHAVPLAPHVELVHRMLLALEGGAFDAMLPRATADQSTSFPAVTAAVCGLAALHDGQPKEAAAVATALAERPRFLLADAFTWSAAAFACGELVAGTGSEPLAHALEARLVPYRGVGLTMSGLAYFGVADRILGICARALGRPVDADDAVRTAAQLERERGWAPWARRASSLVAS